MRQYVIDAFTDHVFAGNPAGVCVMDAWLPEDTVVAYQASRRGGTLYCTQAGERIRMSGKAAVYSVADICIN